MYPISFRPKAYQRNGAIEAMRSWSNGVMACFPDKHAADPSIPVTRQTSCQTESNCSTNANMSQIAVKNMSAGSSLLAFRHNSIPEVLWYIAVLIVFRRLCFWVGGVKGFSVTPIMSNLCGLEPRLLVSLPTDPDLHPILM